MAVSYLLDTSVLTRLGEMAVMEVVRPLASQGRAARARISDLEVGFSARNDVEWDDLMNALDAFPLVETTAEHLHRALQVQRLLAVRSQRGRKIPDLLVAAAAEEAGHTVLHYDSDFDLIASVTGQASRWVVPRGSVD
ncbi:MAG: PIN domain nuclease [Acidimicrobiia bacterium]|nr:PIN domain nuclease [Acidimicrobiia bacterium]